MTPRSDRRPHSRFRLKAVHRTILVAARFIVPTLVGLVVATPLAFGQNGSRVIKLTFFAEPPSGDLVATLPGAGAPAFRFLVPEWINSDNLDVLKRAHAIVSWGGPFHTAPQKWTTNGSGTLRGVLTFTNLFEAITVVEPHEEFVAIKWELRNLTAEPWQNPRTDFCMNLNAGGGQWANKAFLPASKLDRNEDGAYWHDHVASRGAYVHSGGQWIKLADANDKPLDASVIAVANEQDEVFVFMMWNVPVTEPWINHENACMHLRPQLGKVLEPGKSVTIHGREGMTRKGLAEVWRLYGELKAEK